MLSRGAFCLQAFEICYERPGRWHVPFVLAFARTERINADCAPGIRARIWSSNVDDDVNGGLEF